MFNFCIISVTVPFRPSLRLGALNAHYYYYYYIIIIIIIISIIIIIITILILLFIIIIIVIIKLQYYHSDQNRTCNHKHMLEVKIPTAPNGNRTLSNDCEWLGIVFIKIQHPYKFRSYYYLIVEVFTVMLYYFSYAKLVVHAAIIFRTSCSKTVLLLL